MAQADACANPASPLVPNSPAYPVLITVTDDVFQPSPSVRLNYCRVAIDISPKRPLVLVRFCQSGAISGSF